LRRADKTLSTICTLHTHNEPGGPTPEPTHCTCKNGSTKTIPQLNLKNLLEFKAAWDLWSCLPETCTCANGKTAKVPLPARVRNSKTPKPELQSILREAQQKLREAGAQ